MRKKENLSLRRDKEIWGENLFKNIDVLKLQPSLLARQDNKVVKPVKVIERFKVEIKVGDRKIPVIPENLLNVYGSFCDFLKKPTSEDGLGLISEELSLKQGTEPNFFPFAYDWRQDNQDSADRLAQFIRDKDKTGNSRYRLIVHSMGGIVARLMLLDNPDIRENTDLLFQIASPLSGSARAYYTLKKHPELNESSLCCKSPLIFSSSFLAGILRLLLRQSLYLLCN